jgi:phospholipid/cholesterol/gamma-HCH transport system substrate-binding protein
MRRPAIVIALLLAAVPLAVIFGLGAGGEGGGDYKVRAIFDNASFVIAGEDVKVAGAKVGVIDSLDVTPDRKAAIVLKITRSGFKDFRTDATCAIRLQSVIGEKLVECIPTRPAQAGTPTAEPLKTIPKGQPGAGQHLLPVENTSTPVDADLINDIQRKPFRQGLSILLNELGTGLAARAGDLRDVVRRANPALAQFDRFLKILADQNTTLRDLAQHGDEVLSALARKRQNLSDFFVQSGIAGEATAEKRRDLERNFEKFPPFLRQLRPFMLRYAELSSQMQPVVSDLRAAGPDISRFLIALGPFSKASTPALKSLGQTADIGRPALESARPIAKQLNAFATKAQPVTRNLAALLVSLDQHRAIQRVMDVFYNLTLATNGFDEIGHYLRNNLIPTACTSYATVPGISIGCSANYGTGAAFSRVSASSKPQSAAQVARYLLKALGDTQPKKSGKSSDARTGGADSRTVKGPAPVSKPKAPAQTPPSPAATPPVESGPNSGDNPLLDYLLGSGQ